MGDRSDSDEAYVLHLIDRIVGRPGQRGHRFDWLRGDPTRTGRGRTLPVDAFWPDLNLAVEVYERQHDQPVAHFDKPAKVTVSGVHRGEQRRIYDQRRRDLIPGHDVTLLIVRTTQLVADRRGRLLRDLGRDEVVLASIVHDALAEPGVLHEAPSGAA